MKEVESWVFQSEHQFFHNHTAGQVVFHSLSSQVMQRGVCKSGSDCTHSKAEQVIKFFFTPWSREDSLCVCHKCKCHVIPYLPVYSAPSWGPHVRCRQTDHSKLSALILYLPVSLRLPCWTHHKVCLLSLISPLWCKVQDLSLF